MHPLTRTARMTGVLYLCLGITGMLGFLVIRPQVFITGDAGATLDAIVDNLALARLGLALEVGAVVTQVLTALWFFKLFRTVNAFVAASLAVLGLVNAVALLGSAAALSTSLQIAGGGTIDAAIQTSILVHLSEGFWSAGVVFFGLWLIPMGTLVLRSGWAPKWLGWALIAGGIGYVASTLVAILAPEAILAVNLLTIPSIIGEFWMIGYLLVRGVHPRAYAEERMTAHA